LLIERQATLHRLDEEYADAGLNLSRPDRPEVKASPAIEAHARAAMSAKRV